jgi:nucleoside-diphosphate-sugar epimerase
MTLSVLVSGANGFVGKALSSALLKDGHDVTGLVRRSGTVGTGVREWLLQSDDFANIDQLWRDDIRCDVVIHLAARVHVMHDTSADPLAAYRATNVNGSLRLAKAARAAGARRFVYVSSVKAIAEASSGAPLRESDTPGPQDPYGVSKLEAEHALLNYGRESGLEVVVVRPPLVYGSGVRANFFSLMRAIAAGIPLPLGSVRARRSMVYIGNLVHALIQCAIDPRAAGQIFHVTDGYDPTVAELARLLAKPMNARAWLLPVPPSWLRLAGRLTGKSAQVDRLIGELRLDTRHIQEVLGWKPPFTLEQGLTETAAWYRAENSHARDA